MASTPLGFHTRSLHRARTGLVRRALVCPDHAALSQGCRAGTSTAAAPLGSPRGSLVWCATQASQLWRRHTAGHSMAAWLPTGRVVSPAGCQSATGGSRWGPTCCSTAAAHALCPRAPCPQAGHSVSPSSTALRSRRALPERSVSQACKQVVRASAGGHRAQGGQQAWLPARCLQACQGQERRPQGCACWQRRPLAHYLHWPAVWTSAGLQARAWAADR